MDTTTKGNELEDKVFSLFSEMIVEDRFYAKKDCCRIFKKKGYFSKDREKDIVFDIAIEITLPGESAYSVLVLIECKNYGHRVPVDDVEEFFAKVEQITPSNTKSIVVTTNSFQDGVFKFARSKGIGLLRYFNRESFDWVLHRSPSSMSPAVVSGHYSSSVYQGLHIEDYESRFYDCYGFIADIYTNSLNQFISSTIRFGIDSDLAESLANIERGSQPNKTRVPYMERYEIEAICQGVLKIAGYLGGPTSLEKICDSSAIIEGLEVRRHSSLAKGVLGTIVFDPPLIEIDDDQAGNLPRIRFTIAHELGHLLLGHQKHLKREVCHESDIELDKLGKVGIEDIARMEWQANYFASSLLLPTEYLIQSFLLQAARHQLVDRGHGLIYLDEQPCNTDIFYSVTSPLMKEFQVSRSVVKIRLKELGYIYEKEFEPKKLKQLFQNPFRKRGKGIKF